MRTITRAVATAVSAFMAITVAASSADHPLPLGQESTLPTVYTPGTGFAEASIIALKSNIPPDNLSAVSTTLSPVYDIKPKRVTSDTSVVFPVAAADLNKVGTYRPSTTNLFISMYEPSLEMWIPLDTSYNPESRTISAIAPHFSLFRKDIVSKALNIAANGIKTAASEITGLLALGKLELDALRNAANEAFFPRQQSAECQTKQNDDYKVTPQPPKVHGCVATESSTRLLLENHYHLPFDVISPSGTTPQPPWSTFKNLDQVIPAWLQYAVGHTYLPPLGISSTGLSTTLTNQPEWHAAITPDAEAIAMNVILALLSVLPEGAKFEHEVTELRVEIFANAKDELTLIATMRTYIERERIAGPGSILRGEEPINFFDFFQSILTCAHSTGKLTSVLQENPEEGLKEVYSTARDCLNTSLKAVGDQLKENFSAAISALNAIPDLYNAARETGQLAELTHDSLAFSDVDVRHITWSETNWESLTRDALGCLPSTGELWDVIRPAIQFVDLTGDGVKDAIVDAACPTDTSSNPSWALVYDGATAGPHPQLLFAAGKNDDFRTTTLTFGTRSFTISGEAVSDTGVQASPDIMLTETYAWNGSTFIQTAKRQSPLR
ncbi:hypothetical protein ACWEVP_37685 [Amycolatopsis sp. NPDC003865]